MPSKSTAKSKTTRNSNRPNTSKPNPLSNMLSRNVNLRKNSNRRNTPNLRHGRRVSNHSTHNNNSGAHTSKPSPQRSTLSRNDRLLKSSSPHSTRRNRNRSSTVSKRTLRSRNPTMPGSLHSTPSNVAMNQHDAPPNSSASSTRRGTSTVRSIGSPTTAPGNNVADTMAIAFLRTDSVDTLAKITAFASPASPSWWLADSRASSIRVIGSAKLTPGRNTGATIGTTTMTSMWPTSTTAITCATAGIPALASQSTSRCSDYPGAPLSRLRLHE